MKNSENSRLLAEKCYNKDQINFVSETSLKRSFVTHIQSYAQRSQKGLFFLQRDSSHPLRRNVVDSVFLQQTQNSSFAQEAQHHKISLWLSLSERIFTGRQKNLQIPFTQKFSFL